ncbi:MAG: aliphatic sulfonate ABC transporter substrate-binding protein [Tissierellales bacterium]|nr:aliphatic sulfonate ABC transporter substrate-binding protein [Tissierellales bacterium]MBN2827318.1 aliphatic sulfonate ABC transporter substrate-binding protein [Tissierellales bacterium]
MANYKRMTWILLLIMVVININIAGCSQKDNEINTVRMAHFPNITHAQALVAREIGAFEEKLGPDINVSYFVFNAGPSEIEAFFAGELDIGYIGPVPAVNGNIKSDGDIVILAGATNAGAIMVVSENSGIQSIDDLQNKKIAIPQIGNTQHLSLLSLLREHNLSDTTKGGNVEVVPVSNPDIKTLLENGGIDAAYVPEPWGSRLIHEIGARILLDEKEVFRNGQYSTALLIGRKDYIEAHPEIVKKIIEVHYEMTQYIEENPETAKMMLNTQIEALTGQKLSSNVIDSVFERLYFSYDPISESVMDFMNISKAEGFIDQTTTREKLFMLDILNAILEEKNLAIVE